MKFQTVIVLLIICAFFAITFLGNNFLKAKLHPKRSFKRLIIYFIACLVLIFILVFLLTFVIGLLYPDEIRKL